MATEPPPRWALACPGELAHVRVVVRTDRFYCRGCNQPYDAVVYRPTGERVPHDAFVERWGAPRYEREV